VVGHIYTLFFVVVSWAIFAIEDFAQLGAYLKVMFGLGGVPLVDAQLGYYVTSYLPILLVAAVASTPLGAKLYHKLKPRAAEVVCTVLVLAGLVVCTAYLVDGTYNPFLYFRF
jgi:alginate O-acetyltransferase complex protein AlgI